MEDVSQQNGEDEMAHWMAHAKAINYSKPEGSLLKDRLLI
jgi:hypothetical protein